jgi:hypothetical protein
VVYLQLWKIVMVPIQITPFFLLLPILTIITCTADPMNVLPPPGEKLMENLWGCIILAFTKERSQVLLAHEL